MTGLRTTVPVRRINNVLVVIWRHLAKWRRPTR